MVLDAQPLLILFHEQPGWEYIDSLLEEAVNSNTIHFLSPINFGEIFYTLLRGYGNLKAKEGLERVYQGPIDVIAPSVEQSLLAARFKAGGGISYADCFAGALALERGLSVLTGDPEFKRLEKYGVKIEWLPPNR